MYESFFKLSGKPFQLNPDPAFFYGSRGHRRAMAYLEYGLHQSEGFIVITGEIGAGKTTIVRSLLEQLDPDKVVAANIVSTQIDASDMLRMVAAAFGVPSRSLDKAGLLLALETYLVSVAAAGKRALLLVDEAQNLTPAAVEELRMLSNFQLEDHALLQSFLVGQPEFRDIMQRGEMQQLRQRVIASYHLGPLDLQETQGYIEHRLTHVGWAGDPIFQPGAYTAIYGYTGGIPRRINTLCDRLMLAAYIAERHVIAEDDVREVIDELKQEFAAPRRPLPTESSPDASLTGALDSAVNAVATAQAGIEAIQLDLDRLQVSPELAERAAGLAAGYDLQRIEARLAGLEQSAAATLGLLSQLLQAVRRERPAGEERQ
ncbi:XrtA/PEP-CTERM system-associated ATPase [Thauera mechernichensis]|uniref:XrtA/PEP-CTERM system-associated ATPase n=1 Tax=Thauera mechernichensis TaxID=82788 RepID=A0ABW3WBE8_9RHOO|nr:MULTISPECIES: XrtA/PEP-CTERM system-associated ATPase [Thauera]MDG3065934.1 XrtA-associated ATPase [Thauera mechernichensis]HNR59674.1 XrtA-associated ATPase [Thauera sp.]HNS91414.1 XrtA-associated ATPase [Thauera sp.]HRJ23610.1 XrtA-associated ATPase [Thauera sp.]HRK10238.1 XrtA-associated ATPase [Thauera sp.]